MNHETAYLTVGAVEYTSGEGGWVEGGGGSYIKVTGESVKKRQHR